MPGSGAASSLRVGVGVPKRCAAASVARTRSARERDRCALLAGPGPDAALPGARCEIGVAFGRVVGVTASFDAHLPVQRVPVHDYRGARVDGQVGTLARQIVGEEGQVSGIGPDLLAQHDARRRCALRIHRGQHHRVRIRLHRVARGCASQSATSSSGSAGSGSGRCSL